MKATRLVLLIFLTQALALLFVVAAWGASYNVIEGTSCNEWTPGKHNHEPDNKLCDRKDLEGTAKADKIVGKGGWDYEKGKRGNDLLIGNGGMDQVYAGRGSDTLDLGVGHDHGWGNQGDDKILLADRNGEGSHVEEAHGQEGTDYCVIDNDAGDIATDCERVTVVNDDGSKITWRPNASTSNTPAGVNATIKMPNDHTGPG